MLDAYEAGLRSYLITNIQARRLLERRIITPLEYGRFDTITAKKYGINLCSIFRRDSLIIQAFGGNMSHQEVRSCPKV